MEKYIIIETCDRELGCIDFANTIEEAINKANNLLKEHCKLIDCEECYEDALKGYAEDLQLTTSSDLEAWCNLKDMKYDVYIAPMNI